MLIVYRN